MAEQANKRPAAHIVVEFGDSESRSGQIELSLDSDRNQKVYGEAKSTFFPGEAAYLRFITSIPEYSYVDSFGEEHEGFPYYLHTSAGTIQTQSRNIEYTEEEIVIFSMQSSAELKYTPDKIVSWKWLGKNYGTPKFSGSSILAGKEIVGVLKCTYTVIGDRCKLLANSYDFGDNVENEDELPVHVLAVQKDQKSSVTVSYSGEAQGPVDVELRVADFCSGDEVDSVDVYVDGDYIGKTNVRGRIYIGKMIPNSEHTLKMTKTGFVDSDLDVLYNDLFRVPSP